MPLPGDLINIKTVKPDSNLPDNLVVRLVDLDATQQQFTGTGNPDLADIDARTIQTLQNYGPAGFQGGNQGGSRGGFRFGLFGFPKLSGLDKALGILGTGLAVIEGVKQLSNIGVAISQSIDALKAQAKAFRDSIASAISNKVDEAKNNATNRAKEQFGTFLPTIPQLKQTDSEDWRIKIKTNLNTLGSIASTQWMRPLVEEQGVIFPYTPTVTVTHKANYKSNDLMHNIYTQYSYQNSGIDDITITGDFTCNTDKEGLYWLAATQFFKSTTKSFYGQSNPQGMPPVVCRLFGYGTHFFDAVPVVIKSFQIQMPKNVQYKGILLDQVGPYPAGAKINGKYQYVPMESQISIVVSPMYNKQELRQFDIRKYSNNELRGIL
jgi:hypothetical protein